MMCHGSHKKISGGYLRPYPSAVTGGQPRVFGTPYIHFDLQYLGKKWTNKDFEAGRVDDTFFLIEKRPGVFARTYRKQKGYLYSTDTAGSV